MNHRTVADYSIVGFGLAGACLALQLLRRKRTVMVFDVPSQNKSSSVAAGLINPVSGKMLAKAWMADTLFPYVRSFYNEAETLLKRKIFFPMPLYTPFVSAEEQNSWMVASSEPRIKDYIESVQLSSTFGNEVNDPLGGVLLRQGGYIMTQVFIEAVRDLLKESASYREELFLESTFDGKKCHFNGVTAGKIILCRGVDELKGNLFSWLPIHPLKGETLTIRMGLIQRIYNRGVYVVPGSEPGKYLVGATYERNSVPGVTDSGRSVLIENLDKLIRISYEITDQSWGMRPSTVDRRPLIGTHPKSSKIVIFNGLGTKGVLLAPFFSEQLASWLEGEGEIIREVNITRFKSLYSKFD